MTITNGYATLAQYKTYQRITSTDAADDGFIESAIESASRWIDREAATQFFPTASTRYYDIPLGNTLLFDVYYSSLTSVTNGDGAVITDYVALPGNTTPIYGIRLKPNGIMWQSTNGNPLQVIAVAGNIGYSATTPADINLSCLELARAMYGRRFGENLSTRTVVTAAGVVQIPDGVPDWVVDAIAGYKRIGLG